MTRKQIMIDILHAHFEVTLVHLEESQEGLKDGYTVDELETMIRNEKLEGAVDEALAEEEYNA